MTAHVVIVAYNLSRKKCMHTRIYHMYIQLIQSKCSNYDIKTDSGLKKMLCIVCVCKFLSEPLTSFVCVLQENGILKVQVSLPLPTQHQ